MSYTIDELDRLWKASYERERKLKEEYMRTHTISSRGIILTPEIKAEHAERKRLFGEYLKIMRKNE